MIAVGRSVETTLCGYMFFYRAERALYDDFTHSGNQFTYGFPTFTA